MNNDLTNEQGVGAGPEAPMATPTTPEQEAPGKSSGPIVGIIIIVLVIALGGIYFWKTQIESRQDTPTDESVAADVATLTAQGTSDDVNAIEEDLTATDLDTLDAELNGIEAELTF